MRKLLIIAFALAYVSMWGQTYSIECKKNEMVDKAGNCVACPNTDELFTGLYVTRPTGQKLKIYSPLKVKLYSDSTIVQIRDAYGNTATMRINQITTYDTLPDLLDFLVDCSLVDSVSGGGGVTIEQVNDSLDLYVTKLGQDTVYGIVKFMDHPTHPSATTPGILVESASDPYVINVDALNGVYVGELFSGATTQVLDDKIQILRSGEYTPTAPEDVLVQSEIKDLISDSISGKQATLVSGTNIKTINGSSVLGSGDLTVGGGDYVSKTEGDTMVGPKRIGIGGTAVIIDSQQIKLINTNDFPGYQSTLSIEEGLRISNGAGGFLEFLYNVMTLTNGAAGTNTITPTGITITRDGYTPGATDVLTKSEVQNLISGSEFSSFTSMICTGDNTATANGIVYTPLGTGNTRTVSTSSTYGLRLFKRVGHAAVAATTAVCGIRTNTNYIHRDDQWGGGFKIQSKFGITNGLTMSNNNRVFCGLNGATNAAPTDVAPSTKTNIIGAGWEGTDTIIYIYHNDGSGTATMLPTSLPKPLTNEVDVVQVKLYCAPGNNNPVTVTVTNLKTGVTDSEIITTDLPAETIIMYFEIYLSAGGSNTESLALDFIDYDCWTK